jgi:transcriptional regulator with XRE-family HTH domain
MNIDTPELPWFSQGLTPETITRWRERLFLSQREAARKLGCSRGALAGWESGQTEIPRYIGLAMAALALGIDPWKQQADESDQHE